MQIVRFRVALDSEEVVFRDIDIPISENFELLHHAVVQAFGMDEGQLSSFYESNENWDKGIEIPLVDMGTAEEPMPNMVDLKLEDRDCGVGYRLLYVFDFLNLKIFYLEAMMVIDAEEGMDYPHVAMRMGPDPKFEDSYDISDEALLQGVEEFDPDSDLGDIEDDFDEARGHENIDDLDGLI